MKTQITNNKRQITNKDQNNVNERHNLRLIYDLEERTFEFAKDVRSFVKTLHKSIANTEDTRQVVKSSGSVGANYIEANEALGKKDFLMHVRISRKEAKESLYWLRIISENNDLDNQNEADKLIQESLELKKILSSIIEKSK